MLIIPVRAPLVDILGYVVKPKSIWRPLTHALRTIEPKLRIARLILRSLIAPGVELAFESSARSPFPFGLGWKTIELSGFL